MRSFTKLQIEIMRHTLGYRSDGDGADWKNSYYCVASNPDIEDLIADGFMAEAPGGGDYGGAVDSVLTFRVTDKGRNVVESFRPALVPAENESQLDALERTVRGVARYLCDQGVPIQFQKGQDLMGAWDEFKRKNNSQEVEK